MKQKTGHSPKAQHRARQGRDQSLLTDWDAVALTLTVSVKPPRLPERFAKVKNTARRTNALLFENAIRIATSESTEAATILSEIVKSAVPHAILIYARVHPAESTELIAAELLSVTVEAIKDVIHKPSSGYWGRNGEVCQVRVFLTQTEDEWQSTPDRLEHENLLPAGSIQNTAQGFCAELEQTTEPLQSNAILVQRILSWLARLDGVRLFGDEVDAMRRVVRQLGTALLGKTEQRSDKQNPDLLLSEISSKLDGLLAQRAGVQTPFPQGAELCAILTPEQEAVFERLTRIRGNDEAAQRRAEQELLSLRGNRVTKPLVDFLKRHLKDRGWGIKLVDGSITIPGWLTDPGRPEGGYMRLCFTNPKTGKTDTAATVAEVPAIVIANRPDRRRTKPTH